MNTFRDCPHAPACSAALGCCHEHERCPVSWATGLVDQAPDGTWVVHAWRHPQKTIEHRSGAGEPADHAPIWACEHRWEPRPAGMRQCGVCGTWR